MKKDPNAKSYDPLYRTWSDMKTRCYNKNHKYFGRYGGRGITVCDEWLASFEAFLKDMGRKPSPKHSLDRIDNDMGYSKENCKWSNISEQQSNREFGSGKNHSGVRERKRKSCTRYEAVIGFNGKKIYLGVFEKECDAIKAYCEKRTELYG